jgi:hypothetical protein
MNEREVHQNGQNLCRACAGKAYYHLPVSISLEQENAFA